MKLSGLSICFPCYNDSGTIGSLVVAAFAVGKDLAQDLEVIVVNDGSGDSSAQILKELAQCYPQLKVVTHPANRGYGATLRTAFEQAQKEWVFYTDGDGQYDVLELAKLCQAIEEGVEVINGFKVHRADPPHRVAAGWCYNAFNKLLFRIQLKDIDCDFRLIRKELLKELDLKSDGGEICVEMVTQWERRGVRVKEVPVRHYHRVLGHSQFFQPRRVAVALSGLLRLWWKSRSIPQAPPVAFRHEQPAANP